MLKKYEKAPTKFVDIDSNSKLRPFEVPVKNKTTLWGLVAGALDDLTDLVNTSSLAGLIVPGTLILVGTVLLAGQVVPEIDEQLRQSAGYFNQGVTPLVAQEYITGRSEYLSDPGSAYFRQLTQTAFKEGSILPDPVSNNYSGTFYITIPSLGMNRLPVQANVESGTESVYKSVLKTHLAHFRNTGLPISDVLNNIVIYGHSARAHVNASVSDPEMAFTYLSNIAIGDNIEIEMDGKKYMYKVMRSKIIEPDDTSIVNGNQGKRTLTLFTCYPRGNNSQRFVAIAQPI